MPCRTSSHGTPSPHWTLEAVQAAQHGPRLHRLCCKPAGDKSKPWTLPCTSVQPPSRAQVWEVAAQLAGLGASVLLLRAIEATGRPENVVAVWAALQAAHVALRYQSLAVLRFGSLNQKRACACAAAHAAGRPVPGAALRRRAWLGSGLG